MLSGSEFVVPVIAPVDSIFMPLYMTGEELIIFPVCHTFLDLYIITLNCLSI